MTQNEAILEYLKSNGSITPLDALMNMSCFRLGARIYELRAQGHEIRTDLENSNGKIYARYSYITSGSGRQHIFVT